MDSSNAEVTETPDLIDLIQLYALRMDPLTLTVESAVRQLGWVGVADGAVVGAWTASGMTGVDAFVDIVAWESPRIVGLNQREFESGNITLTLSQLLMDTYWAVLEHEPSEPPSTDEPTGLEEDTLAKSVEAHTAPDGVTREVLDMARQLSDLDGFVAIAFFDAHGEVIDTLGNRRDLEIPSWLAPVVAARTADVSAMHAEFLSVGYIDVLLPPCCEGAVSFLLRLDRGKANRGLVEVALRPFRRRELGS